VTTAPQRIVLATFGSHGDVHPFVGLGKVLKDRGHSVVLHTSAYFESLVTSAGLAFNGYGTHDDFLSGINNPDVWHPRRGYKAVFGIGVRDGLRPSYDALSQIVTPDTLLIGSSLALSARILHDKLGCPGATIHLSPAVMRSSIDPPVLSNVYLPRWLPRRLKDLIWKVGDEKAIDPLIAPTLNALRAELDLPPVSRVLDKWWNHPARVIGLWPDWYGPAAPDWPPQFRHTDFPLYDESDVTPLPPQLQDFLDYGTPPIAFTPGSAMLFGRDFFLSAVDTCRRLNHRGVLLTRHTEQLPPALPDTILHVPYAPFSRLLPRCSAIVHHGGIGTTAQALHAGVPQLIVHFSHDQPDNAARLHRLGVGTGLSARRLSAGALTSRLNALFNDPGVGERCRHIRTKTRTDGLQRTADLIEQLVPVPAGN
jgi:rhamnosyltransferase subunit B